MLIITTKYSDFREKFEGIEDIYSSGFLERFFRLYVLFYECREGILSGF